MGQAVRTMDSRSQHLCIRSREIHSCRYSDKDTGLSRHLALRTAYHLPVPDSRRPDEVRPLFIAVLHHCRRSVEPRRIRYIQETDRHQPHGRFRTDRNHPYRSHHAVDAAQAGQHGIAQSPIRRRLIDHDGRSVEAGEQGQIVIRTDKGKPLGLFKEYYRDANRTREAWHDNIYYTGDVAWKDEDGYLWFVGRADDVIKSSGYRIGPFEVESALMTHPAVIECAITGVPDEIRGQVVKATIVLSKDYKNRAGEELVKELQNHVKKVTAPYKYPRVIEFVDELPKTISGKIRRVEIRKNDEK